MHVYITVAEAASVRNEQQCQGAKTMDQGRGVVFPDAWDSLFHNCGVGPPFWNTNVFQSARINMFRSKKNEEPGNSYTITGIETIWLTGAREPAKTSYPSIARFVFVCACVGYRIYGGLYYGGLYQRHGKFERQTLNAKRNWTSLPQPNGKDSDHTKRHRDQNTTPPSR